MSPLGAVQERLVSLVPWEEASDPGWGRHGLPWEGALGKLHGRTFGTR